MQDPSDYELQKSDSPPAPIRETRSAAPWIVAAVVLIAAGMAGYFFFAARQTTPTPRFAEVPVSAPPASPADRPLGGAAEPIQLPPLDQTDAIVRRLAGGLSAHPGVAAWLATDNLIRSFVVVVENIAAGGTPAVHLRQLRPSGRFRVAQGGEEFFMHAASYDRYNRIADAANSIDPAGAARLYSLLKPRIEEAYRELGSDGSFDRVLERAIVALLRAPVLEGNVRVEPHGAMYRFDDPAVERLTAAQKQLVRMGPRNVRLIQGKLRNVALELGIPPDRLSLSSP